MAKGIYNADRLIAACDRADVPVSAREALTLPADGSVGTQEKIARLIADIHADAKANDAAQRPRTIPGIDRITASALVAALREASGFRSGRDLAARIGLTPKPHSTGGKGRLGRILKTGNRDSRRLLFLGTIAPVGARRRGEPGEDWLWMITERKKPEQAAIALANRIGRPDCALLKNGPENQATRPARLKPGHLPEKKGKCIVR
ncbi:transposase IS116/IS110/IS902 family protein [Rhodovulum visakhapatnamense]|uniref:Transposase IS116/IS110/IS902 family protein n=1 Tax=Rhodovulum visakhapatnamense TaxID=364297 RepID=A0A4R8G742_9RHOB|nr:transposase IS116/IS110/IS902 family protein [Rhodovulum visakhapatnamense]